MSEVKDHAREIVSSSMGKILRQAHKQVIGTAMRTRASFVRGARTGKGAG